MPTVVFRSGTVHMKCGILEPATSELPATRYRRGNKLQKKE